MSEAAAKVLSLLGGFLSRLSGFSQKARVLSGASALG
jgi:hypothetical protein